MTDNLLPRASHPSDASEALAQVLITEGFDAEVEYSGGGIFNPHVVARRGQPRPIQRMGVVTDDWYSDPLDYLALPDQRDGESYPEEPFGFDIYRDGEYVASGAPVYALSAFDGPGIVAWLKAHDIAAIIASVPEDWDERQVIAII